MMMMMMMMTARLQLSAALLCLFCFTASALDLQKTAQITQEVQTLQKEKQDIAKRFVSTDQFSSRVLDKGLALVEQMEEMVEEYGLEEEFPSVAKLVENVKSFLEDTKDFTTQQLSTMVDTFKDKETKITLALLKLLED